MTTNPSFLPNIGIDIEEISRFAGLDRKRNRVFLEKIFTPAELKYCFSVKDPAPHLAARFAGKEAVIKALSGCDAGPILHSAIEISRDGHGAPSVHVPIAECKARISLSHCKDKALAVAIVTVKNVKKTNKR